MNSHASVPQASADGQPGPITAEFAEWADVFPVDEERPLPTLILGNSGFELHYELDEFRIEQLLLALAEQSPESEAVPETEEAGKPSALRRAGAHAVAASGWPVTDQWWRSAGLSTRIIVLGVIAAVMVLGLLVTF